ncbi:MAG: glycine betaine ABC transporter substrate-binding protein [Marinobacter sp.]|uniref:glycine betaine ABC transporter substrate-binding protein n=1 Tax=Marinobacter sp. TaxID=50741 RepID=UPI003F976404
MKKVIVQLTFFMTALLQPVGALADECKQVSFGAVSWTDVQATTATAETLLTYLGYEVSTEELSVPEVYQKLDKGELDIFLGNWMPTMEPILQPYLKSGSVEVFGKNLKGAKYTLAVPTYVYEAGVQSFADIARFKDKFENELYGLERGNDGNALLLDIIAKNDFALGQFSLMELPERLMLHQVKSHIRDGDWIAFLAWAPHPMNEMHDIRYLSGGDEYFGPNLGGATVSTNTRAGYRSACPNVAKLLDNLEFSLSMEGELMNMMLYEFVPGDRAARDWMFRHPETVTRWLNGVTNQKGEAVDPAKLAAEMRLTVNN